MPPSTDPVEIAAQVLHSHQIAKGGFISTWVMVDAAKQIIAALEEKHKITKK